MKSVSISFAFLILLIYLALIISLMTEFNWNEFSSALMSKRTLYSIKISLITATISTIIAFIIALPAAYALSRYRFKGRKIIDLFLELPLIVSPAALGAMVLIFFSSSLGTWFQDNFFQVIYTFWAIIIAQFVTVLGISARMLKTSIEEVPKRYEDVAATLGASPFKAFTSITLPLMKKGMFSAFILTWAKAFGEFGATFTVAGTIAEKTETIPVSVYMKLSSADISGSIVMIMILISVGISMLILARTKLFSIKK